MDPNLNILLECVALSMKYKSPSYICNGVSGAKPELGRHWWW